MTNWNALAEEWERHAEKLLGWRAPLHRRIAEEVGGASTVIDFATGVGEPGITVALARPASVVWGVDTAERMVEAANRRAEALGAPNFRAVLASDAAARGPFSAMTCCFGLEYVDDYAAFADRVAEQLEPSGRFVCAFWGPPSANAYHTAIADVLEAQFGHRFGLDRVFWVHEHTGELHAAMSRRFDRVSSTLWEGTWPFESASAYLSFRAALAPGTLGAAFRAWSDAERQAVVRALEARVGEGTCRFGAGAAVETWVRR